MKTIQLKSATILLLALITLSSACLPTCRFKLCTPGTVSLQAASDVPLTSSICLNGQSIGVTNTGEALVEGFAGMFVSISDFNPPGLLQNYSPHFFKAYPLSPLPGIPNPGSGIGHEVPQQNQNDFLGGSCVALPINAYQELSSGIVIDNIHLGGNPLVDCVSFVVEPFGMPPAVTPTSSPIEPTIEPLIVTPEETFEPSVEPSIEPLPVDMTVDCDDVAESGGQGTTTIGVNLGQTSGTFTLSYQMFPNPDQLEVFYEGNVIFTTGGLVSGDDTVTVPYSGSSTSITVVVTAPNDGTRWEFTVFCPTRR